MNHFNIDIYQAPVHLHNATETLDVLIVNTISKVANKTVTLHSMLKNFKPGEIHQAAEKNIIIKCLYFTQKEDKLNASGIVTLNGQAPLSIYTKFKNNLLNSINNKFRAVLYQNEPLTLLNLNNFFTIDDNYTQIISNEDILALVRLLESENLIRIVNIKIKQDNLQLLIPYDVSEYKSVIHEFTAKLLSRFREIIKEYLFKEEKFGKQIFIYDQKYPKLSLKQYISDFTRSGVPVTDKDILIMRIYENIFKDKQFQEIKNIILNLSDEPDKLNELAETVFTIFDLPQSDKNYLGKILIEYIKKPELNIIDIESLTNLVNSDESIKQMLNQETDATLLPDEIEEMIKYTDCLQVQLDTYKPNYADFKSYLIGLKDIEYNENQDQFYNAFKYYPAGLFGKTKYLIINQETLTESLDKQIKVINKIIYKRSGSGSYILKKPKQISNKDKKTLKEFQVKLQSIINNHSDQNLNDKLKKYIIDIGIVINELPLHELSSNMLYYSIVTAVIIGISLSFVVGNISYIIALVAEGVFLFVYYLIRSKNKKEVHYQPLISKSRKKQRYADPQRTADPEPALHQEEPVKKDEKKGKYFDFLNEMKAKLEQRKSIVRRDPDCIEKATWMITKEELAEWGCENKDQISLLERKNLIKNIKNFYIYFNRDYMDILYTRMNEITNNPQWIRKNEEEAENLKKILYWITKYRNEML